MRKRQHRATMTAATLCTAVGVAVVGAGPSEASNAKVPSAARPPWVDATSLTPSRDQVIEFHGRIVTLRDNLTGRHQLSISRAVPGDLVSLTDRLGRVWTAKVQPGATSATTPWVQNAVRAEARTVDGKQIAIPIP